MVCLFSEDVKGMPTDTNTRVIVKCVFCAERRDVTKIVTKYHKLGSQIKVVKNLVNGQAPA